MKVFVQAKDLNNSLKVIKNQGNSIGFVPTMGALHLGHISLVKKATSENKITVASIFVNPTQFNDKQDLLNYPRTLEKDLEILERNGCDFVFTPTEEEMYPEPDTRIFNFGLLEQVMEGKHRPGHFNGVGQIVSKLFQVVPATRAYFGEKDFQQVAIIKKLVTMLKLDIEIVSCPILREPDGLAMSSRNTLLNAVQRAHAPFIFQTLQQSLKKKTALSVNDLKNWVISTVDSDSELKTEYFDIVNDLTFDSVASWNTSGGKVGCIAVRVGKIRLIDNIRYNF
jgi:pantoate--beta-alanine ligase